jgi:hypothetical protein
MRKYVGPCRQRFLKRYASLNAAEKSQLMAYYQGVWRDAIFPETLAEAEKRIGWMRDYDATHSAR